MILCIKLSPFFRAISQRSKYCSRGEPGDNASFSCSDLDLGMLLYTQSFTYVGLQADLKIQCFVIPQKCSRIDGVEGLMAYSMYMYIHVHML